jgi:hypothetical protein
MALRDLIGPHRYALPQDAAELLPDQAAWDCHMAGLVIGDKSNEGIRPAQRAVNACLARARAPPRSSGRRPANHLRDRGPVSVPANDCQRCPDRFRGEIHSDCQHRSTLFLPGDANTRTPPSAHPLIAC